MAASKPSKPLLHFVFDRPDVEDFFGSARKCPQCSHDKLRCLGPWFMSYECGRCGATLKLGWPWEKIVWPWQKSTWGWTKEWWSGLGLVDRVVIVSGLLPGVLISSFSFGRTVGSGIGCILLGGISGAAALFVIADPKATEGSRAGRALAVGAATAFFGSVSRSAMIWAGMAHWCMVSLPFACAAPMGVATYAGIRYLLGLQPPAPGQGQSTIPGTDGASVPKPRFRIDPSNIWVKLAQLALPILVAAGVYAFDANGVAAPPVDRPVSSDASGGGQ